MNEYVHNRSEGQISCLYLWTGVYIYGHARIYFYVQSFIKRSFSGSWLRYRTLSHEIAL